MSKNVNLENPNGIYFYAPFLCHSLMKRIFIILLSQFFFPLHAVKSAAAGGKEKIIASGASPVTFLQNKGQLNNDILFQSISTSVNVYFLRDGLSFALPGEEEEDSTGKEAYSCLVWNMKFANASPLMNITGKNEQQTKLSFLYGNDSSKWVIHPPEYSALHYNNIYPGIDLIYYGAESNLKCDYILHPGAAVQTITAFFEGVQRLSVNDKGELEIATPWNVQLQKAPVAWQVIHGKKKLVKVRYALMNDTTFGFRIEGNYNPAFDLIIDPLFEFIFGSFTKATGISNNINYCFANATDASGNVYLTGMVDGTYPTTAGAYSGPGAIVPEIFVSKFSKDGSSLIYSTYISGTSSEVGLGIAVDASGRAYITGYAESNFTGTSAFPTTASAYQPVIYPFGGADAILTVLNAGGTGLVYSTYLGGSNNDYGYSIALDNAGMAYITGYASSDNASLPAKATTISSAPGTQNAFIAKFDISQTGPFSLVYLARMGGNGYGSGRSIAVNSAGNAFITGSYQQFSTSPPFPATTGAYNNTYNSGSDNMMAFAAKLSSSLPVDFDYCTFIAAGIGNAISVDPLTNEAYIAGSTRTFAFPVTPGVVQPVHGQDALANGNSDAFVTKLNASGNALVYSTFIGGEGDDYGTGIDINSAGEAYISGTCEITFPVSPGAFQSVPGGGPGDYDYFTAHLNDGATSYGCGGATYIGGNDMDYGTLIYDFPSPKVSVSDHGGINDTISVSGTSHSLDFPTTAGSYSPSKLNSIADQPVFFKLTCNTVPLPVELISFSGKNEGFENILEWVTASESNNDYFEVQRKTKEEDFEIISKVNGRGTTTVMNQYKVSDKDINPAATYYYRLKQVDYDSEFHYSKVIAIRSAAENNHCHVYVDEAAEILFFNCNHAEYSEAEILSIEGRVLKRIKTTGMEKNKINFHDLSSGLYILRTYNGQSIQNFKLVKK